MRSFSKLMDWMSTFPLLVMSMLVLTGCTSSPTISEGNLYLQAQSQQVQINTYKLQLQDAKKRLTQVIPEVKNDNPTVPQPLVGELSDFLASNDCTKMTGTLKDGCYKVTRVKLINVTQALEEANVTIYANQVTVNQLIGNINVLIDSLGQPTDAAGNPVIAKKKE